MSRYFLLIVLTSLHLWSFELQKGQKYTDQNISAWMISEKLDGIRAYWDGEQLFTRQQKKINAPQWFVAKLPPFALDGELWSRRGDFENIQSIVLRDTPDARWKQIKYMIFEVPKARGDFLKRLQKLEAYLKKNRVEYLRIIEQKICQNALDVEQFMDEVKKAGGEGAMLKDASKEYFDGRTASLLKVKEVDDAEAVVIGYKEGRGKYAGMIGSLQVRLENGEEFFIGSGLSDVQRKNPPKIGDVITFKHYGVTKYGKPKFASFMRIRED
ncbi:MAG: DNA ligase [Helicobacteraceae bacterium]|nr:DNA ligase [Helicobacteraceae bacterium]